MDHLHPLLKEPMKEGAEVGKGRKTTAEDHKTQLIQDARGFSPPSLPLQVQGMLERALVLVPVDVPPSLSLIPVRQ